MSKELTVEFEEIGKSFHVTFKRKSYESRMSHGAKVPEKGGY